MSYHHRITRKRMCICRCVCWTIFSGAPIPRQYIAIRCHSVPLPLPTDWHCHRICLCVASTPPIISFIGPSVTIS